MQEGKVGNKCLEKYDSYTAFPYNVNSCIPVLVP